MFASRFRIVPTVCVLALAVVTSGCGRGRREMASGSLMPKIDVNRLLSSSEPKAEAEQQANDRIDRELNEARQVASNAESKASSWRDKIMPKINAKEKAGAEFGEDPFLDDIDSMIASGSDAVSRTKDKVAASAEDFADFAKQGQQQVAQVQERVLNSSKQDFDQMISAAEQDLINAPKATLSETLDNAKAAVTGDVEGFFADAGETKRQLQGKLASYNNTATKSAQDAVDGFDQLFVPEDPAPRVPDSPTTPARTMASTTPPEITPSQTVASRTPSASDFADPGLADITAEPARDTLFSSNEKSADGFVESFDLDSVLPDAETVPDAVDSAFFNESPLELGPSNRQDPVQVATRPDVRMPPTPAVPDQLPEIRPTPTPRVVANKALSVPSTFTPPGDPEQQLVGGFTEPAPLDSMPAVGSFAPDAPEPPAEQPYDEIAMPFPEYQSETAPTQQPSQFAPTTSTEPQVASVLPEVDFQTEPEISETQVASPLGFGRNQWTAWFLIGSAVVVCLLLFAPGRRA